MKKERKKTKKKKPVSRDIGMDTVPPTKVCEDAHCPYHGKLPVRGLIIQGTVVSDKMRRTVVVERVHSHYVPKYERFEKRTRRHLAHNPPCINAGIGSAVNIAECRPLSKTVSFVVVEAEQ